MIKVCRSRFPESQGQSAAALLAQARRQLLLGEELRAKGYWLEKSYIAFSKVGILIRLAHARAVVSNDERTRKETMEFTKLYSTGVIIATKSLDADRPFFRYLGRIHTHYTPSYPRPPYPPPVRYWDASDISGQIRTGLKNIGKTGYMNATLQCLLASIPVVTIFTQMRLLTRQNAFRTMGMRGRLAGAFARLIAEYVWADTRTLSPTDFRTTVLCLYPNYKAGNQYDSQEFLSFLLDVVHQDMNRRAFNPILSSTKREEDERLESLSINLASEQQWQFWKTKNDSMITDYFHGQLMDRIECLTCHNTSRIFNAFSLLHVPIPDSTPKKILIQECLNALFTPEILEQQDGWNCPCCRKKQRAKRQLALFRLPPILIIHLNRFVKRDQLSKRVLNLVDFPLKELDLTSFMPSKMESEGAGLEHVDMDDPRIQVPPYKYDLCGVTNHDGNLTSGHYTAWVHCLDKWLLCDDEVIREGNSSQVVGREAYVLFYKRTKSD
ncbi:hypothetical protein DL96DRAFT_1609938 [Flagelloscypha sp. PMI_526]|nr:hypothetical protein DL96DRAFT_1609938 [Flagelloscypha sp. PMI_526]